MANAPHCVIRPASKTHAGRHTHKPYEGLPPHWAIALKHPQESTRPPPTESL